jgi:hypothetical protein
VGIVANYFWDTVEYTCGITHKGKAERVEKQHKAFIIKENTTNKINPDYLFQIILLSGYFVRNY